MYEQVTGLINNVLLFFFEIQCFTITIKFWPYQKIGRMFGAVKHGLRRVC